MIIKDLRKEFYGCLLGKRVLLIVNSDIDGICGTKILQHLFRSDHILYTLVPVQTRSQLKKAFNDHAESMKNVILLNCGGCIDIIQFLEPNEDIQIYIADNHRPLDVCNIYNSDQVKVLLGQEDIKIPAFDDIFMEDESEDEDESYIDEEKLEKRRKKRLWTQQRQKLLFEYYQYSSYGSCTSILFYDLAWKLSKDSNELLWWTIIAETELYITGKIEQDGYLLEVTSIQNHVSRRNHKTNDVKPLDSIRIAFDKEINLVLYRHWTLVESMKHSPQFASSLKIWTLRGENRMRELLAEVGLPLIECNQNYKNMDLSLKNEVSQLLAKKQEKYALNNFSYPSFVLSHGFKYKFSASDYVHSCMALLENPSKNKSESDCFCDALDALSISNIDILERGIESCKTLYEVIYKQVTTFLNLNQIISAGPFLYATVMQNSPDSIWFSSPQTVLLLAQFTLIAHSNASKSKKTQSLPLIITVPDVKNPLCDTEDRSVTVETCLVCGIPPVSEENENNASKSKKTQSLPLIITVPDVKNPLCDTEDRSVTVETCLVCGIPPVSEENKNLFGKAFELAVENTSSNAQLDFFDTYIIRLSLRDRSTFFDSLISLLS